MTDRPVIRFTNCHLHGDVGATVIALKEAGFAVEFLKCSLTLTHPNTFVPIDRDTGDKLLDCAITGGMAHLPGPYSPVRTTMTDRPTDDHAAIPTTDANRLTGWNDWWVADRMRRAAAAPPTTGLTARPRTG